MPRHLLAAVTGALLAVPALAAAAPQSQQYDTYKVDAGKGQDGRLFCRIIGPVDAAFGIELTVWSDDQAYLSLTNTVWKLGPDSRGSVTFNVPGAPFTREFARDFTTRMSTKLSRDDAGGLKPMWRLPVVEVTFPGALSYQVKLPTEAAGSAFDRCTKNMESLVRGQPINYPEFPAPPAPDTTDPFK